MDIAGYREEGSTTTPFDVMLRYRVAGEAIRGAALFSKHIAPTSMELGGELQGRIKRGQRRIFGHGAGESCRVIPEFVCLHICFYIDPAGTYDLPTLN